ncbi:hypothetical protein QBC47DRAFT_385170 [Echria macrotheca]|uniref:Uncharacterized protein n=1 Tax=Echria macrotheca TaxID=438768 RepID=A0AAJ0B908_9PEZI|nr:hypothetical protein QBC47DRAFT_385170 [Echria macrotheca]
MTSPRIMTSSATAIHEPHHAEKDHEVGLAVWEAALSPAHNTETAFFDMLSNQDEEERTAGRAALWSFYDDGEVKPTEYTNAADFQAALSWSRPNSEVRQLVVLEGLAYDWIDALRRYCFVPPHFFALHRAHPDWHHDGRARAPVGQSPLHHFVLSYDQYHQIEFTADNSKEEPIFYLRGAASRTISMVEDDSKKLEPKSWIHEIRRPKKKKEMPINIAISEHLVSYWGADHEFGGWTAVILVDPPRWGDPTEAVYYRTQKEDDPRHSDVHWARCKGTFADIRPLPRVSGLHDRIPIGKCMFDDIVHLGEVNYIPRNVWDATRTCRRLVLAHTAARVQKIFSDAYDLKMISALNLDLEDIASFNFKNFDERAWNLKWEGRRFTRLWERREDLELIRFKLRFNIKMIESVTPSDKEVSEPGKSGKGVENRTLIREQLQDQRDLDGWKELDRNAEYIEQMIQRATDSYLQTVAACEAFYSSIQATFIGRITKMATVFVPVSLVAAIFSMAGDFAAGSPKFWLFWAISMPIAVALICWMFGLDTVKKVRKQFKKLKRRAPAPVPFETRPVTEISAPPEAATSYFRPRRLWTVTKATRGVEDVEGGEPEEEA